MELKKFTPTEIVAALIFYSGIERMTSEETLLHRALFLIKKDDPLLQDFYFSTRWVFPDSPPLALAMCNLKSARFIRVTGNLEEYYIEEGARAEVKRLILPLFSEEERQSLVRLAEQFRATVIAFASEIPGCRIILRRAESPLTAA